MNTMTEQKDPTTLITESGWCYRMVVQEASFSFNYDVHVYRLGRKIGHEYAMTKWGGRMAARKIRRRHQRRQKLTGETRALR